MRWAMQALTRTTLLCCLEARTWEEPALSQERQKAWRQKEQLEKR